MITVPRYTPQVGRAPLPGLRVPTPPQQAASPIPALGQVAGIVRDRQEFVEKERARANDVQTQDAYQRLVREKNRLLYDPQTGAYSKRGRDAMGVLDVYHPAFDKAAGEIEKGLANDEQRAMFQRIREQERTEFDGALRRHHLGEADRLEDDTFKATVETTIDDAVTNHRTPDKVRRSVGLLTGAITTYGARRGWTPEQTKAAIGQSVSGLHAQVIDQMLAAGRDLDAEAYWQANKDAVTDGRARAGIERGLERGSREGAAQRFVDEMMRPQVGQIAPDGGGLPLTVDLPARTLQEARAEAAKRFKDDVKGRRLAEGMLEAAHREVALAAQAEQNATFVEAWKRITPGRPFAPTADLISKLTPEQIDKLEDRSAKLAKGQPAKTDPRTLARVSFLRDSDLRYLGSPDGEADLLELAGHLSEKHYEALLKDVKAAQKPGDFNEHRSANERIFSAFRGTGLGGILPSDTPEQIGNKGYEKQSQAFLDFKDAVDDERAAHFTRTGKNPDHTEEPAILARVAERMTRRVKIADETTLGWFFNNFTWGLSGTSFETTERSVASLTEDDLGRFMFVGDDMKAAIDEVHKLALSDRIIRQGMTRKEFYEDAGLRRKANRAALELLKAGAIYDAAERAKRGDLDPARKAAIIKRAWTRD